MLCTMDSVCKAFNHGNVNICFNHGVGKRKIGMWMGEIRGEGCEKGGYEKEGKGMSVRGGSGSLSQTYKLSSLHLCNL